MKTAIFPKQFSTSRSVRQSVDRGFRLAPILVAVAVIALYPIQTRANTIVFDTLGPGNTYELNGATVGFGGSLIEAAAQFTAQTSGTLSTVDLGLASVTGTTPGMVNVFLYGDAGGSPNNADQTLLGSVTAADIGSIASLTVSGNVSVIMGSTYWLVLKPTDVNQHSIWGNSSPSATGTKDFSRDDVTWEFNNNTLPAFRITAQSVTVPDSGGTLLIMLISVPALLVLQRMLRNERSEFL